MKAIRNLLVDDKRSVRQALLKLPGSQPNVVLNRAAVARSGAHAFVAKQEAIEVLLQAIRSAANASSPNEDTS